MDIVRSKIEQAFQVLKAMDIDLWMIYCREPTQMTDPSLALVVGADFTGKSAFLFTQNGQAIALVWKFDAPNLERAGHFDRVLTYTDRFADDLRDLIDDLAPRQIALNYSLNSAAADGLSHGMYLGLKTYLEQTPYADRLISSRELLFELRGVKTELEILQITRAAELSHTAWQNAVPRIQPGMTEIDVATLLTANITALGAELAFPVLVNAGTKSQPGHGLPTDAVLTAGDLLHVDFGAKVNGYCADIQRVAYLQQPGQSAVPEALSKAFQIVLTVINTATGHYRSGQRGCDVDAIARKVLTDAGYPEYQHSLGHQLGRQVHDGGARVGPIYEPSDPTPVYPLTAGNVLTVELGVKVDGIGYMGLEEDLLVTPSGGRFLATRQEQLTLIAPE